MAGGRDHAHHAGSPQQRTGLFIVDGRQFLRSVDHLSIADGVPVLAAAHAPLPSRFGQNARRREGIIAKLRAVTHHQLGLRVLPQFFHQLFQADGPVGGQPPGTGPVHLKPGVVDLLTAGIHGRADLAGKPRQAPGHPRQGGTPGAGQLCRPGQPFGGGHADPQTCERPRPRRHSHQVQVSRSQAAGIQQTLGHGQQGLAVGQTGVLKALGDEGLVLAQGHRGRHCRRLQG